MAGEERRTDKRKRPRTCRMRRRVSKRELIRIIRTPEGEVRYDPTGKANGRGAYLCRRSDCVALAKKKALSRALKTDVDGVVYDSLIALCTEKDGEGRDVTVEK